MKNKRKLLGLAIIAAIALNAVLITGCFMPDEGLAVDRIEITKQPTNKTYNIGDSLDTAGMEVTAYYEDGTSKVVNDYSVSYDFSSPGTKTVTVSYQGKRADFTVTVNAGTPAKTLTGIAVTPPTKTTYAIGEQLNTAGMVVTASYSDGSTEAVTAANISGFDSATAGTKTVTVTYEGKTANFTVTVQAAIPAGVYGITGSGTAFTAVKDSVTIGTADQPIQTVINSIRSNANGQAARIQFGDGTTVLDIGADSISFNNTGGTWGAITLTGKINSSNATYTIYIATGISVSSGADIANTTPATNATGDAVRNEGILTITTGTVQADRTAVRNGQDTSGTLTISGGTVKTLWTYPAIQNNNSNITISGGTVSATGSGEAIHIYSVGNVTITGGTISSSGAGTAVYNEGSGEIKISGGTVSATTGTAISSSTGKVTVSGTAKVTSASTLNTINIRSGGTSGAERLVITGGTVENTSANGNAINNNSNGLITISGGVVSATAGRAADNISTGTINITGGEVKATSGRAVNNGSSGSVNISGGAVSANTGIAVNNGSTGKITVSGTANITSGNTSNTQGTITIENITGTNTRLEINGGTIVNTQYNPNAASIPGGYAIYNSASSGVVSISSAAAITGKKYGTP